MNITAVNINITHLHLLILRVSMKKETMIILNFVPQNLSSYEIKNIKRGLRSFFEYGDGSQCDVSVISVYEIFTQIGL